MYKSLAKDVEKLNRNMNVSCEYLLSNLKRLFEYSLEVALKKQTPSARKPAWARISIQAASVMGDLLKTIELDDLRREIEELKHE